MWKWHVGVACGSGKEQHFKSKVWILVAELKDLPDKYQPLLSQSYRSPTIMRNAQYVVHTYY